MNQNKTTSGTKPGGRDFINLGIFTVIFIILFLACIMVMSMNRTFTMCNTDVAVVSFQ